LQKVHLSFSSCTFSPTCITSFASGGFGGNTRSKKQKKKKKRLTRDQDIISPSEFLPPKPAEPELDRFGLPILTAENFFPLLPPDTELISAPVETTLSHVKKAMTNHIPINYDLFDENGNEKGYKTKNKPWNLRLLHLSPPVLEVRNFFTPEECKEYTDLALKESKGHYDTDFQQDHRDLLKVDSATFSSLATSKRTSTTWFCHYVQVPSLLVKAKRLLSNISIKQIEEPQIVRYRQGEEFSWHYDELPIPQLANGGQRVATLLVYLNDVKKNKGGGTVFRDLKDSKSGEPLIMQPKLGSALLFFPAFNDGIPDDRTLHKGEPSFAEKMIAQIWIHHKEYKSSVPEGNSHTMASESIQAMERDLGYK